MKPGGAMHHGSGKNPLQFGIDADQGANPGSFYNVRSMYFDICQSLRK